MSTFKPNQEQYAYWMYIKHAYVFIPFLNITIQIQLAFYFQM